MACLNVSHAFILISFQVSGSRRKYVSEIQDCCDMERRLKVMEEEILKYDIPIREPSYIPDAPDSLDVTHLKVSSEHIYIYIYYTREDIIETSDN
jgi:hypothetical protein